MLRLGIDEILASKRDEILRIAAKHGVSRIRVFGSVARGDAGPDSDVDFLIEIGGETPPWFPGGLIADLEELLGRHSMSSHRRGCTRSSKTTFWPRLWRSSFYRFTCFTASINSGGASCASSSSFSATPRTRSIVSW